MRNLTLPLGMLAPGWSRGGRAPGSVSQSFVTPLFAAMYAATVFTRQVSASVFTAKQLARPAS